MDKKMSAVERLKLGAELARAIKDRDSAPNAIAKLKASKVVQEMRVKLGIGGGVAIPAPIQQEDEWGPEAIAAAKKQLESIIKFIPKQQYKVMRDLLAGEEGEYFGRVIAELSDTLLNMPKLGKSDNGYESVAYLHYFGGPVDVWVTEVDIKTGEAYGAVSLGYEPELGYLSMGEYLNEPMMNIDFHWKPTKLKNAVNDENDDGTPNAADPEQQALQDVAGSKKDTSGYYVHVESDEDNKVTRGTRQKANNAAIALLKQFASGERDSESITEAEKVILAKYTGSGGNLKTATGKMGSAYEYYTPKPIATGVWNLLEDLGFSGGKVLDPCAGVGIFGATSPKNAAIDAIELSDVSGGVNKLVNGGVGHSVTVAPFEKVAAATPDGTHDAVVANVPFGPNSARGGNQQLDSKYQKDSMEAYFMLRSMDKLKPNGLAAFIVPPRVVSGRGAEHEKLRLRLALKGEFMGAYRLPSKVFSQAHADTITDVIVLRKHSSEVQAKIEELYGPNTDALREANVLWPEFIDGHYFTGEGKKFVLGEFVAKDPNKMRDVDRVISDQSVANIGKLLCKFGKDSRINFEVLEMAEVGEAITYKDGDTIALNGEILTMQSGQWVKTRETQYDEEVHRINSNVPNLKTPLSVLESGMTWKDFSSAVEFMTNRGQAFELPTWASELQYNLARFKTSKDFGAIVTGLAAKEVQSAHADDADENLVEAYPLLADAMKRFYKAKISSSALADHKGAVKFIGIHYNGTEFSSYWRGEVEADKRVDLDTKAKLAKTQYIHGTLNLKYETAKAIVEADGLVFDPLNDDEWVISADGKTVIRADDYYIGNLGDTLRNINAEIEKAEDPAIKAKLERMKLVAHGRSRPVDVDRMQFNLRNPLISAQEAAEFLRTYVSSSVSVEQHERTKKQYATINITKADTLNDKLLNRVGDYIKNGTVSLGGIKLPEGVTEEQALTRLDEMVRKYNTQFSTWVKSNPAIMGRLRNIAENPDNVFFDQADDRSEFSVDGISPEWKFHGYQCSFARRMSRRFSGINGFDVGLGKTATALMSVQYVQNIGVKKKTLFVVPNSVLSNWRKEAVKGEGVKGEAGYKAPVYANGDDCLFVGLTIDKKGVAKVNSKDYDRDLNLVLENKHSKVFMTYEAFKRLRLRDETIEDYSSYLRKVDKSYGEAIKAAEEEGNKSKLADLIAVLQGSSDKASTAAPFFEDMGFDSVVIDEAHVFKNSKATVNFVGGKFLSKSSVSSSGLDAQAKVWYIRQNSVNGDGVLALTATPITNSPLEIYSMLTLAAGEERVNKMMLGAQGSDEFMEIICKFEEQQEETVDGRIKSYRTFTGLQNVDSLRQGLHDIAVIENAESVGNAFTLPESPEMATGIALPENTAQALLDYKAAYSVARELEWRDKTGNETREITAEEMNAYMAVMERTGEDQRLLAQPFNLINKMNNLIVDPDLDDQVTYYYTDNEELALKVCQAYNAKKITDKRTRLGKYATDADIKKKEILKDEDGDVIGTLFTVYSKAYYIEDRIVLDSTDFKAQLAFEGLVEQLKLDVDVSIPPKFAALIENVKQEMAHPRGVSGSGISQKTVKQIVFCDMLSSHNKIKRLLSKHCGIPAAKITFISGQYNNEPEALLDVQAGFNAGDEDNLYQLIIANKKAEVGINLQKGCQAIHHLTIGWTPDSLQQRNGRGVRQGNETKSVTIYHYDADGTFDSYRRRLVNKKAEWIDGLIKDNGRDEVDVSGGLTKEQQNALINIVGDAEAMANFQAEVDEQDRKRRIKMTRSAQDTNLATFVRTKAFLKRNENFKYYADGRLSAFIETVNELKAAREHLEKSIQKEVKASTIKNNTKAVKDLEDKFVRDINHLSGAFTIKHDKFRSEEEIEVQKAIDMVLSGEIDFSYSNRLGLEFKGEEVESAVKNEWANHMQTNQAMNAAADKELTASLSRTGSYNAAGLQALKNGEKVLRFNGDIYTVGSVALLRSEINGETKEAWTLVYSDGRQVYLKGCNFNGFSIVTVGGDTAENTMANSGNYVGVYEKDTPEYQKAIEFFARFDNKAIEYRNGELTAGQMENLMSHYVPEVAQYHEVKIEQLTQLRVNDYLIAKDGIFPFILDSYYSIETYSGKDPENMAKWQALRNDQAQTYKKMDTFTLETATPEQFERRPSQDGDLLLNALRKFGVKAGDADCLVQVAGGGLLRHITYAILPDQERVSNVIEAINAAKEVGDVLNILNAWVEAVLGDYVVKYPVMANIQDFKEMHEWFYSTQFEQSEITPIKNAVLAYIDANQIESDEDYVYLTGDTKRAFKEIPFRQVAASVGSLIGWKPENKNPKPSDKAAIAKAPLAPEGVWIFQRKAFKKMKAEYAAAVAMYNLEVKKGH